MSSKGVEGGEKRVIVQKGIDKVSKESNRQT